MVGESERAFYGAQLADLAPILAACGVEMWLPELDGPLDLADPVHQAVMVLLGAQGKREVQRSRFRTLAAMRAQARDQGRYLGGRPPYGYLLVDAGPHPNRVHAQWGRRLQRLEPDPATAPHVRWMFAQRLQSRSLAGIARALNDAAVPSPSRWDQQRNRHRTGECWTLRTVAAIMANPRYTGRQVWNRQRTDRETAPAGGGYREIVRWAPAGEWIISRTLAHPSLVSEEDFVAVQGVRSARPAAGQTTRTYRLTGMVRCGVCGRRMDSHWMNNRPAYRCRHGRNSAHTPNQHAPKILYIREDRILAELGITGKPAAIGHAITKLRDRQASITCDGQTCRLQKNP